MSAVKEAGRKLVAAYEATTEPAKGKERAIKVAFKEVSASHEAPTRLKVTLSGKAAPIDALTQHLLNAVSVPDYLGPIEGVLIHLSEIETADGPATEKPEDQTKTVTINHTITTN